MIENFKKYIFKYIYVISNIIKNNENNNLSIFATFCIDTEERYLHMDPSKSFQNANIKSWCVNKGKLKSKAKDYLLKI